MCYNPFSLKNKNILVTGASSGIGRAVAIECSKAGANITITGRDLERLNETYSMLKRNPNQIVIVGDLNIQSDIEYIVESCNGLNGIVNCAGILKKLPFKFINKESLTDTMQTNFYGAALLTQKAFKMKKIEKKASIVFISSIASHVASYGSIMYMASKGAINSLTRGIALELANKGIRVNYIEPGLIKTKLVEALSEEDLEKYEKEYPLGRFGKPEEVAYAVIFLLSDATEWITGSKILIDGGITLN